MGIILIITIATIIASDLVMAIVMVYNYSRISDRLFNMSERINEIRRPRQGTYQDYIRTQPKNEVVFTGYDRPEEVIESMTQSGYTIIAVLAETMFSPADKFWIPLDRVNSAPTEGRVIFVGKRDQAEIKFSTAMCNDYKWLKEWWKGGWQANI